MPVGFVVTSTLSFLTLVIILSLFLFPLNNMNKTEFLNLGAIDILGQTILHCGELSCAWQSLSSLLGIYPLDPPSSADQRHLQMLPDVPWCGGNHHWATGL